MDKLGIANPKYVVVGMISDNNSDIAHDIFCIKQTHSLDF